MKNEGEMRILRVLLSHTDLEMKIRGAVTKPQGDGVSGPFFAIYFEHYLKKLYEEVKNIPINIYNINSQQSEKRQPNLPNESLYVDDYDFITEDEKTKSMVIWEVSKIRSSGDLQVNEKKQKRSPWKGVTMTQKDGKR